MRYLVLSLIFVACASAAQIRSTYESIELLRSHLQDSINSEDIEEAVTVFTDDVVYLQPGSPPVVGREAIQLLWQGTLERMAVEMEFRAVEVELDSSLGFVVGDVTWRGTPRSGGESIQDDGRYVWILRRENGQWKISRYMRHSK